MGNNGKYQISTAMNDAILEMTLTGKAAGGDLVSLLNEMNALVTTQNANKAIFDVRGLEQRIEPGEIYRFVRNQPSILYEIKSAIVDLPENAHYATAMKNAGLAWEWFTDMNEARDFLNRNQQINKMNLFDK